MPSRLLLAAALLLCASVAAQDIASIAAVDAADVDAQAMPAGAAAPRHYGHSTCNRFLPGCKRCIMYYVRRQGRANAAKNATALATNPDTFGRVRKVYVCKECLPGFNLIGSGNLNDPKPKYCVPAGGEFITICQAQGSTNQ